MLVILFFSCSSKDIPQEVLADYLIAKKSYESGEVKKANGIFKEISDNYSSFYQARFMYGKTEYFLENMEKSMEIFLEIKNDKTDFFDAAFWYGRLLLQTGNTDLAESEFLRLLSLNSQDPRIMYQLALIKTEKNDISSALDYLKKASLFKEEYAQVFLQEGKIFYSFDLYDKSIDSLNNSLALLPEQNILRPAIITLIEKVKNDRDSKGEN
ncbi:MAG: hypothetical protein PF518_12400 [Spirochaetaceae bacterium]|nr:hypothetical protein [Spirochaetaceae bacterium]